MKGTLPGGEGMHPHPRIEYGAGSSPLPGGEGIKGNSPVWYNSMLRGDAYGCRIEKREDINKQENAC